MEKSQTAKQLQIVFAVTAMLALSALPACGQKDEPNKSKLEAEQVRKNKMHVLNAIPVGNEARISVKKIGDKDYVAAQGIADILEYRTFWDIDSLTMKLGVTDPELQLKADAKQALKADKPVELTAPPVYEKDALYIPVEDLGQLFGTDMVYRSTDSEINVNPNFSKADKSQINAPADPEKGIPNELQFGSAGTSPNASFQAKALGSDKGIDAAAMEALGRRYLGIKYKFGTGPFSQTGFFDCSSFMQFLFEKQNIELPRTARAQAELGTPVSRNQLQPGDLLFFYVPGRFRTDEVVGHVGLFIGNGQMLHSSPAPEDGVQITDINKPYWADTFMKAKRISGSGSL